MTTRREREPVKAGKTGAFRSFLESHRVFIAILTAGVLLRGWNIGWGFPYLYEEAIPLRFGMKLWPSLPPSVDYHFFVYPAFTYYLQLFVQFLHFCAGFAIGTYANLAAFIALFGSDPSAFTLVARATTVIADAGIIIVCYHLLDKHFNRASALIAAALIAFNVLHLKQSHLVNVDTFLTFFSAILLLALYRLAENPSTRNYVIAGLALGLASASKYNGAFLAVAIVAVHLLTGKRIGDAFRPAGLLKLATAGAASVVIFIVLNPLIIPHFDAFLEKFADTETHMEAGHLGIDPGTSTTAYYFLHSLPGNLGLPIALTALLSAAWIVSTRERKRLLLLLTPAIFVAMVTSWEMRADRYIFPAIPFLLMISAVGIDAAFKNGFPMFFPDRNSASESATGTAAAGTSPAPWTTVVAISLLLILPVRDILTYQHNAGLKDTRSAAREWIEENVPRGSAIAAGPFGIELPPDTYINLLIQFSAVNSERMTPFYNPEWYRDLALVAVGDYDYARYELEPSKFHAILSYRDTLRTSWTLVRAFEPGDSLNGPSIRLYRYPGPTPDAPFSETVIAELLDSDLEPERKVAFLGKLGLILSAQGKFKRSQQLFTHLLTLEPGNETARQSLRDIETIRTTERPPAGSSRANVLALQGDRLLERGNLDAAEKAYKGALKMDSTVTDAYLGLTMVYALREDRDAVLTTLRKLLSVLPPGSEDYARVLAQIKSVEEVPK
jgi:4-amino-4-deoxy-L-arabinose transferase-like glycosyltransferase/tetratricopeptide (TPR) repeat protein